MKLRTRLRYLRTINGMSQESLAAKAGCSPVTISRIERTGNPPKRAEVLQRLADAFGIKPVDLFTKDADEADPLLLVSVA